MTERREKLYKQNQNDYSDFNEEIIEENFSNPSESDIIMVKMTEAMIRGSLKLTKMVINNSNENGNDLDDNEIYEIYRKSFRCISDINSKIVD